MSERELRIRFECLDVNRSGFLEEEDFEAIARLRVAAVGESLESAKAKAVLDGYRHWWAGMSKDQAGRVTYEAYCVSLQGRDTFDANRRPQVEAVFDLLDADDDGYINEREFVTGHRNAGFDEAYATELFATTDTDRDGKVSKEELVELIRTTSTATRQA